MATELSIGRHPPARRRLGALVRRAGAALLSADPLDPAHPAVVALVDVLSKLAGTRIAAVAPGLAARTRVDDAASPTADGPPLTRLDRSVLTIAHACCAAGKL
ncbi:MAG: hypothetical protein LOD94_08595, partial [Gammaproteobacteria bacterium]